MDIKWILGIPSTLATLVGGGYAIDQHYAKQNDVVILQLQSYEYCIKIIEDIQAQLARLAPGDPLRAELLHKLEYYRKVCGMK